MLKLGKVVTTVRISDKMCEDPDFRVFVFDSVKAHEEGDELVTVHGNIRISTDEHCTTVSLEEQ
jgi:hypothetical protein